MQQRHARYQDTPYALEPNCKGIARRPARPAGHPVDGARGRLRRQLAPGGPGRPADAVRARDLRKAEQAFKRLRIELHLLARRREDRVLFDLQPALAEIYRIHATATRRGSELLMQRYYWRRGW